MKQTLIKVGAVVLVIGLFFVARLPATLAAHALPGMITLAGVQGSVWNGSASALGINGVVSQEKVEWHFLPSTLLHGYLGWQLKGEFRGKPTAARVQLSPLHQTLEDVTIALPLDPLMRFNSTIEGIRLRGTLQVSSDHLARNEPAKLQLRLEQVASAIAAEPTLLGSYQGTVELAADSSGKLNVTSLGGPLQISGGGTFSAPAKAVDMKLMLRPTEDIPALASILAMQKREGDQYVIRFKRH